MKTRITLGLILLTCPLIQLPLAQAASANEDTVRKFVDAFNRQDVDAMLALADENIEWASISGLTVSVESKDKKALRAGMESYWKGCPTCRSKLLWLKESKTRVTALEEASWTSKDGKPKSQQGISVYEFQAGKIARVYYFPAEK